MVTQLPHILFADTSIAEGDDDYDRSKLIYNIGIIMDKIYEQN